MSYENGLGWPWSFVDTTHTVVTVLSFFVLGAFTLGPIVVAIIASEGIATLLLVILLLLILTLDYAISQACLGAIAPTISHTVAQRFNPVAYLCIITIASVIFYSIGIIGAGYVGMKLSSIGWIYAYACLELIGLLIISLVLIFPASLYHSGFRVKVANSINPDSLNQSDAETVFGMKPANWYDTMASVTQDNDQAIFYNTFQVFNISGTPAGIMHVVAFGLGYAMEVVGVILYLILLPDGELTNKWWRIYALTLLIISLITIIGFGISQSFSNSPKQVQQFLEVFSLFTIIMAVIVISLAEGIGFFKINWVPIWFS